MVGAILAAAMGVIPYLGRVAGGLVGAPVRALAAGGTVLDIAAASAFPDGLLGGADGALWVEDGCHCEPRAFLSVHQSYVVDYLQLLFGADQEKVRLCRGESGSTITLETRFFVSERSKLHADHSLIRFSAESPK